LVTALRRVRVTGEQGSNTGGGGGKGVPHVIVRSLQLIRGVKGTATVTLRVHIVLRPQQWSKALQVWVKVMLQRVVLPRVLLMRDTTTLVQHMSIKAGGLV